MRFAPTVPVERRARQRGAAEDNSEPQLPQHVQRLIKQAQLDGRLPPEEKQRRAEHSSHKTGGLEVRRRLERQRLGVESEL